MKRLTVYTDNAERTTVCGKLKTFNTLSFSVVDDNEANLKLSELKDKGVSIVKSTLVFA